ncbi:hypothetical protein HD554DRAFT_837257 [Boletus coccyginus]|nr:hypothetical protein HD554DRAFT_837257 [Boletus coccyginus]
MDASRPNMDNGPLWRRCLWRLAMFNCEPPFGRRTIRGEERPISDLAATVSDRAALKSPESRQPGGAARRTTPHLMHPHPPSLRVFFWRLCGCIYSQVPMEHQLHARSYRCARAPSPRWFQKNPRQCVLKMGTRKRVVCQRMGVCTRANVPLAHWKKYNYIRRPHPGTIETDRDALGPEPDTSPRAGKKYIQFNLFTSVLFFRLSNDV